jgi:HlyD family secretion protein
MKKRVIIGVVILCSLVLLIYAIYNFSGANQNDKFQLAEISRGNLVTTISSSGTLSPVTTVDVGTQVSGTIARIFVDFNDVVKKGQLLAVLDTVMLKASVLDAQAGVERAEAALEEAQLDFNRNLKLFEDNLISEAEFLPLRINLKTQQANLKSAQATYQRAERNLKYAVITSPIFGTVIQRNVEEGQTVAASFSTPTLFKIAEDLSQMEILADVDESDIGMIKEGQTVRFDVQAYSDRKFEGTVQQKRLQPTVVSNVVTYTVVVNAVNKDYLLLPGMTATVDFIIEERKDVLLVPNTALRFQASEDMVKKLRTETQKQFAVLPDSLRMKRRGAGAGPGAQDQPGMERSSLAGNFKLIWYMDENGKPAADRVILGQTDGSNTEIVRSRHLQPGTKVIIALAGQEGNRNNPTTSRPPMGPVGRPPF